jgi:DNA-binding NarL/FixJ family response regulator
MLFKCEAGLEVVGEATSTASLVELAQDLRPDVVVIDWDLKGQPDGALLLGLGEILPCARIIALSSRSESERKVIHAGADAFVSKAEPASALIEQVRGLVAGDQTEKLAKGPADDR